MRGAICGAVAAVSLVLLLSGCGSSDASPAISESATGDAASIPVEVVEPPARRDAGDLFRYSHPRGRSRCRRHRQGARRAAEAARRGRRRVRAGELLAVLDGASCASSRAGRSGAREARARLPPPDRAERKRPGRRRRLRRHQVRAGHAACEARTRPAAACLHADPGAVRRRRRRAQHRVGQTVQPGTAMFRVTDPRR